jgi:hypothetical protein
MGQKLEVEASASGRSESGPQAVVAVDFSAGAVANCESKMGAAEDEMTKLGTNGMHLLLVSYWSGRAARRLGGCHQFLACSFHPASCIKPIKMQRERGCWSQH